MHEPMTKFQKKCAAKLKLMQEKRIEKAYYRRCSGVQIDIMDISKVFRAGLAALERGADELELEQAIVDFVQTIRRN